MSLLNLATTPANERAQRPGVRFMLAHPARWVALGFGAGLSPLAPGTVGTLWAWLSFLLLDRWLTAPGWALLIAASLLVGQWACTRTAQHWRWPTPAPSSGTRSWPSGWCCGW
jgi:phosphatidylglycerophosphatase A